MAKREREGEGEDRVGREREREVLAQMTNKGLCEKKLSSFFG